MPPTSSRFAPLQQRLFLVSVLVERGQNRDLPAHIHQAVVPVFVPAIDYDVAAEAAIEAVARDGFAYVELLGEIRIIELDTWEQHVRQEWPEARHYLPSPVLVRRFVSSGQVFYGPISAYQPR